MKRILLDTSAFIWATSSPTHISKRAAAAIEPEDVTVEVSAISLTEIAIKQAKGKLTFSKQVVETGIYDFKLRVLPYAAAHAYKFFDLPLHHTDPFDRMIIAQALVEDIPIVTSDAQFRKYRDLTVIW